MPGSRRKSPVPTSKTDLANLEWLGDRLEVVSLQALLSNKKRRDTRDAARLGDVLLPWFEKSVTRPGEKMAGIAELWQLHVPHKIVQRSRLAAFHRGTLTVALDSATVRAELDSQLRSGLLRTLQMGSKGALFKVKTIVDGQLTK